MSSISVASALVPNEDVTNLIQRFLDSLDVKDSSKITYQRNLRQFLLYLNMFQIFEPTEEDILHYKTYLQKRELSVLTINNQLVVVKLFFKFLKRKGLYDDIALHIKMLKRSAEFYRDALSVEQIRDLFGVIDRSTVKGKRDFAMINLLVRTGLRIQEVRLMDIGDIYKVADATIVRVMGKGRNEKNDKVVLTHNAVKPILLYLATRNNPKPDDPLFTSVARFVMDKRLSNRSISRLVKEYMQQAGILSPRITPHSLRHTAITLALKGGATLQEAQAMARHHSINTTMIYAHNIDRIANAAEYKIDAILDKVEGAGASDNE